jgi:hypothetical protein
METHILMCTCFVDLGYGAGIPLAKNYKTNVDISQARALEAQVLFLCVPVLRRGGGTEGRRERG